jgi:hypothetical protein
VCSDAASSCREDSRGDATVSIEPLFDDELEFSMSGTAPAPRPASVVIVMVLTWIVAILTVISGVLLLTASGEALRELSISTSDATLYGWIDIVLGVIIALVAIGLGSGNNFSRFLVSALMVLRLIVMGWAVFVLFGHPGFWYAAIAAALAVLILAMLWSSKASAFFRTN